VRAELGSIEPEMRFEAARAAGELELREAGPALAELLEDGDNQVREAAIWSLGQIGGEYARRTLTDLLKNSDDEEEQDFIQEALDNLAFTDEVNAFSLLELGDDHDDDGYAIDEADELGLLDEDDDLDDLADLDDLDDLDALDGVSADDQAEDDE
jgi:HEAT repeat protein